MLGKPMITDPFAPLAPTPAITTAAEARAAGRAAQDNREVPLHDITGHMYPTAFPPPSLYPILVGITNILENNGVNTTPNQYGRPTAGTPVTNATSDCLFRLEK